MKISKRDVFLGICGFVFLLCMMCIVGTIDYRETVIYNMPNEMYNDIKKKVGSSDKAIVKEYMKNKQHYDSFYAVLR